MRDKALGQIIGIGGVSRAGKSTLSDLLAKHLLSTGRTVKIYHQDNYAIDASLLPMIRDRRDWEQPTSIKHDEFYQDIINSRESFDYIIVDGLFAFYDEELTQMMTSRFFIEISKETFVERKKVDFRWGSAPEPDWHIEHIWDSYLLYGLPPADIDVHRVSGEKYFNIVEINGLLQR